MKGRTLVIRSLIFYRHTHLGIMLGTLICTAVIVGALVTGDSVRHSLRRIVADRLGRAEFALVSRDRFFRTELAADMARAVDADFAPVLQREGVAINVNRAGMQPCNVKVLGVDDRFWTIGRTTPVLPATTGDVASINQALADKLGLRVGDELVVRVGHANVLSPEAPFSLDARQAAALRLTVKAIVDNTQCGRFNLRSSLTDPLNVFLSLAQLSRAVGLVDRANMILAAGEPGTKLSTEMLTATLRECWQLADAGLALRKLDGPGVIELRSSRIFLEPPVAESALQTAGAHGVLTYLVNELLAHDNTTPYSFVAGTSSTLVPRDMADDEIILNKWTADDLAARPGDQVVLKYYVPGPMRKLQKRSATFTISSIIPVTGLAADRDLAPLLPGMADKPGCRDWAPGIPVNLDKVRDKDEQYWQTHRGTPKAFVTLRAAQRMWGNRFGQLTAIRWPDGPGVIEKTTTELTRLLSPADAGLFFQPVLADAVRASSEGVDFGGLFIGLSMFIVVAALLLTGLLFVLGVEQRVPETGTLLALGFSPRLVRRLLLAELIALGITGGVLGSVCGAVYGSAVLAGLNTVWRDAVNSAALSLCVRMPTVAVGAAAGTIAAVAAASLALTARTTTTPVTELLAAQELPGSACVKKKVMTNLLVFAACSVGVLVVFAVNDPGRGRQAAAAFFGAGALLLIACLASCNVVLLKLAHWPQPARHRLATMGVRNCARNRSRSLVVIGIIAASVFIVVTVAANRYDPLSGHMNRKSGTGGFTLYCETALPILHDLNSAEGRRRMGLDTDAITNTWFVPARVLDGDDASCLNLNRAQSPRVLGIRSSDLSERGAFTFVKTTENIDSTDPWSALDAEIARDTIPAVADSSVIVWGLGKKVGDTLDYVDERGRRFKLQLIGALANSILQGNILISEKAFVARFPSSSGYRAFLVDTPLDKLETTSDCLATAMRDFGVEITPAAQRLAKFHAVENTYLSVFLALGGLGLILGSAGLGIVVLRNVLERRGELAILRAVGFSHRSVNMLILIEHGGLLALGITCGALSAAVAVLPSLRSAGGHVPISHLAGMLLGLSVSGYLWTWLATVFATRGEPLQALRWE